MAKRSGNPHTLQRSKRQRTGSQTGLAGLAGLVGSLIKSNSQLGGSLNSHDAAGNALTANRDVGRSYYKSRKKGSKKTSYKKRLANKRKKRFAKRVKKVISGSSPTYHYNERSAAPYSMSVMPTVWGTSPCQQMLGTTSSQNSHFKTFEGLPLDVLYFNNVASTGVGRYLANAVGLIQTRYNTSDLNVPSKSSLETVYAYIKHCQINFSIYNNQSVPINVDVYEFIATRNITLGDYYSTPLTAMDRITSNDATALSNNMSNTISKTDFGATPWDFPGLTKSWKVLSKTSIYLPANGQTNLQYKGSSGMWGGPKMNELAAFKGKTREYVFVVGSRIGVGMDIVNAPIKVSWEKTYKIKPPTGHTWATEGILSAQSYAYT